MKKLFVVLGLALSFAAQARSTDSINALIQGIGKSLMARPTQRAGQPLLRIDANQAVQGAGDFNAFIRPVSDFNGSYVVIDATLDGAVVNLDHPVQDLWIFNSAGFEKIANHSLSLTVSLENASQADQIAASLSSVEQQIQSLQNQIANSSDQNQINQLTALLNQQIALQSQLTTSLMALKNPIGTQTYSFSVTAAPAQSGYPTITSVSPSIGAIAGNVPVAITGTNFVAGATVKIGNAAATNVVVVNSTKITANTPALTEGAKDVEVDLPLVSGESEAREALLTNGFYATGAELGGLRFPVAITGAPQSVALGSAGSLTGNQSVGPTGHALTYAWSLISKPAGSSLPTGTTTATTANASVTPDYPGSFVYQLLVTDSSTSTVSAPSLTVVTATLANASLTASAPAITVIRSGFATSQIAIADVNSPYLKFSYYVTQQPLWGPVSVSSSGLVSYHELATNTSVLVDQIGVTVVDNASPPNSATVMIPVTITASTQPSFSGASCTRQSNTAPYVVYCTASGFSAPNGSISSLTWNYGDGTPTQPLTLVGSSLASYPHYYTNFGSFYEKLSVTDNLGAVNYSLFTRTFSNSAIPTAKFTLSAVSGAAPFAVTANATASSSPVGSTLTYNWIWGDGSAAESGTGAAFATRSHTYAVNGIFKSTLVLTDTLGNSIQNLGTVYVGVAVPATGSPPCAFADITSTRWQASTLPITFNGSTYSMDPNPSGGIASYVWNYGDYTTCPTNGCNDTGASVSHTYPGAQNYFASLTTKNALGGSSVSQFYEVASVTHGLPPRAMFNLPRTTGVAPLAMTLDGSNSFDYDGSIVSYGWTWGDATANSTGAVASHTYTAPGTYLPTLRVVDNDGNSHNYSQTITVTATMVPSSIRDDAGDGGDEAQMQILTNACAQGSGDACDQLASIYSERGDAFTSGNLKARACQLGFTADCVGR